MHPHHQARGIKIQMAFCDGASSLALELSQTEDATLRSATARARTVGSALARSSSRASSAVSRTLAGHCLAEAAVRGKRSK
jgi:hypothetical protein